MLMSARILAMVVGILIVANAAMLWGIWQWLPAGSMASAPAPASVAANTRGSRPSTITDECRTHIKAYLDDSSARMYTYFAYHERLNANNHLTLADEVLTLSKEIPVLPESCPDSFDSALHINYLSVYSSAPIHLHRYLSTATDVPRETANQRIAWRYFEREADIAEQSMYQLLRMIQ